MAIISLRTTQPSQSNANEGYTEFEEAVASTRLITLILGQNPRGRCLPPPRWSISHFQKQKFFLGPSVLGEPESAM